IRSPGSLEGRAPVSGGSDGRPRGAKRPGAGWACSPHHQPARPVFVAHFDRAVPERESDLPTDSLSLPSSRRRVVGTKQLRIVLSAIAAGRLDYDFPGAIDVRAGGELAL